jgi:hypothetical protein
VARGERWSGYAVGRYRESGIQVVHDERSGIGR